MNAFFAFINKEFLEQVRTYRAAIMLAVFAIFGMLSPLLAKLMPEMLAGMDLVILIPEPTYLDAYGQFFKNVTQMGLVVLLLIFGGTISTEIASSTLVNMLSKGLPRRTVILAKYSAAAALWTVSYVVALALCFVYTTYLFGGVPTGQLAFSLFCLWLFGDFVLALLLLASTVTNGNYGGLLLTSGVLVTLLILNMLPLLRQYSPVTLASDNMALLQQAVRSEDLLPNLCCTALATALCLFSAVRVFERKQI